MSKSRRSRARRRQSLISTSRRAANVGKTAEDEAFSLMDVAYAFDDDSSSDGYSYHSILFKTGDDVILNSSYDDTDDIWLGQIAEIRTTRDRTDTLVKVRWYWSRNDVAAYVKSFNATQCSPFERILSDDYDYVSPYAFQEVVHVHEFYEDALDPPPIGPRTFFLRSTLHYRKKQVKPPLGENNCLCQMAYNPYPVPLQQGLSEGDSQASSSTTGDNDVMHFCPSMNCRKWYHASCLAFNRHVDDANPVTRNLRLLAVDPDHEVLFATFGYFYDPESREDLGTPSTDQVTIHQALEIFHHPPFTLAHLPPGLLTVAQSPIVRCAGTSNGWAIGNVSDVVLARRFVYAAIEYNGPPDRSERYFELLKRERTRQEDLFWKGQHNEFLEKDVTVLVAEEEVSAMEALCEDLAEFELLASVYEPYWERRASEFQEAETLLEGPAFMCPQCRSAI